MSARRSGVTLAVLAACVLSGCSITSRREAPTPAPAPAPPLPPDIASVPDAVPKYEPRSRRGNPKFYEVFGKRYHVMESADGHVERGVASWYGPGFHNALTSMGEPYDMHGMTAAHKTLPLPAYARVTNLENGLSCVVRINDRGPFVGNRIIDLSRTAAAKLDMLRKGTALVEVRVITPGAPDKLTRVVERPPPELYVQAGAFAEEANALRLLERVRAAGITNAFVAEPPTGQRRLYRVRIGPVKSVAEFDRFAQRLATIGVSDVRLAND